jgi:flagellar hook assembly protein FlgD
VLKETFTSVGPTLKGSFVIKENPFDPSLEAAEFQYFVDQSSQLEFRILTLTGELVYSIDIPEGSAGTQIGLHSLAWDGRNDEGYIVLNGVYVAVLTAVKTGEQATLKVAVLK